MSLGEILLHGRIEKTADICGGAARLRGTRHTVAGLVQWRRLGLSDDRIIEHHPDLSRDDLEAAWIYFEHNREAIESEIREDEDA